MIKLLLSINNSLWGINCTIRGRKPEPFGREPTDQSAPLPGKTKLRNRRRSCMWAVQGPVATLWASWPPGLRAPRLRLVLLRCQSGRPPLKCTRGEQGRCYQGQSRWQRGRGKGKVGIPLSGAPLLGHNPKS